MLQLLLSLFVFSPLLTRECNSQPLAPALYAFGDSLSDAGNNNWFTWVTKANYKPYGINFPPNGQATGRFTNGKTFVDFIAEYLGLPFPAAYRLLPRSKTGYTYASGGCGILPLTGSQWSCLNMDRQINLFNRTIITELTPHFESPAELSEHLANSIFIVWGGSNDYLLNYFHDETPVYSPEEFADLLIDGLSQKLRRLRVLGARKFVLLEVGPVGCLPVYRINNHQGPTWCDESKNDMVKLFNVRLAIMVRSFTSTYPDSSFTLGQLYSLSDHVFNNPAEYGMTNVSGPCCTTGDQLGNMACYPRPTACDKPDEYMFFDGAHPTQASFSILASHCFDGTDGICGPNTIKQLAQLQTAGSATLHSAA